MTPEQFKTIRNDLGISLRDLSVFLRMGKYGFRNIHRWEKDEQDIHPAAVEIFKILKTGKIPKKIENLPGPWGVLVEILSTRKIPDIKQRP